MLEKSGGMAWGVWQVPESELQVLGDVRDKDVLELGCGAAQWSIALARVGARPVGIDLSERQLDHAPIRLDARDGMPVSGHEHEHREIGLQRRHAALADAAAAVRNDL